MPMPKKKIARRQFLKQSSLATVIAASCSTASEAISVIDQTDAARPQYRGSLAGFDLSDRQFDTRQFCLSSYEQIKPSMSFSSRNARSARLWQKQVRNKLTELLGGFPARRVDLRPQILEKVTPGDYVREKIVFDSREGLSVFGYLLLPK